MDDHESEPATSSTSGFDDVNPYSATLNTARDAEAEPELPVANESAIAYTAIGALLAVGVVLGFMFESVGMILAVFLVRVTWVVFAMRFSRRYAMHIGIRIPFVLVLGLHVFLLVLEVIALILFAVCLAVVVSIS